MSMVIKSEEITQDVYETFKFEESGTDLYFYFIGCEKKNSSQYGEFVVAQGLKWENASTIEESIKTLTPASFVVNKVIQNYIEAGKMVQGQNYHITLTLAKDEKYESKKTGKMEKAKANHFKVERLQVPDEFLKACIQANPKRMSVSSEDVDTEEPSSPKSLPRV